MTFYSHGRTDVALTIALIVYGLVLAVAVSPFVGVVFAAAGGGTWYAATEPSYRAYVMPSAFAATLAAVAFTRPRDVTAVVALAALTITAAILARTR